MTSLQGKVLTFIIRRFFSPLLAQLTVDRLNTFTNTTNRPLLPPRGVKSARVQANGVPGEWLTPGQLTGVPAQDRAMLYLHGGGFVSGSIVSHRGFAGRLAEALRANTLIIDYRLAPAHPFPAALEDCAASYRYLLAQGYPAHRILVAGDSAGGNLALALLLSLHTAGEPLPGAAIGLSPVADVINLGNMPDLAHWPDPMFRPGVGKDWLQSYVGQHPPDLPLISPVYGDFTGLPPILLQAGTQEILLPGIQRLAEKARAGGADLTLQTWEGMFHVFQLFAPFLPEANEALAHIKAFVDAHIQ